MSTRGGTSSRLRGMVGKGRLRTADILIIPFSNLNHSDDLPSQGGSGPAVPLVPFKADVRLRAHETPPDLQRTRAGLGNCVAQVPQKV
jgi:hypothetical protein